jgi:peptidoglycan/xylan/chitin deacetylase (PgdA/CDA1 family)
MNNYNRRIDIVLVFHGIGSPPADCLKADLPFWVKEEKFLRTLDIAKERGDTLITFDDGLCSDFHIAMPALLERGLPGVFFPLTGMLGKPGFLSEEELRTLSRKGMTIGTHGHLHMDWAKVGRSARETDIHDSLQAIESILGASCKHAAFPFGSFDRRVLASLRKFGIEKAYSCSRGKTNLDNFLIHRTSIRESTDLSWMFQRLDAEKGFQSIKRGIKRFLRANLPPF